MTTKLDPTIGEISSLLLQGLSLEEIGQHFSLSKKAIWNRAKRHPKHSELMELHKIARTRKLQGECFAFWKVAATLRNRMVDYSKIHQTVSVYRTKFKTVTEFTKALDTAVKTIPQLQLV